MTTNAPADLRSLPTTPVAATPVVDGAVVDLRSPAPRHLTLPGDAGPAAPSRTRRHARRAGRVASSLLVLIAIAVFAMLAIGPRVFEYRTATMLTASMAPGIEPGDVVVTVPRPADEVAVGDVLSYHIPVDDHRVVTHRVVEVIEGPDGVAIRTKGDANTAVDPWTAILDGDTVYEVSAVVPHVGDAIRTLRTDAVQTALVRVLPVLLVILGLISIWRRPTPTPADSSTAAASAGAPVPDTDGPAVLDLDALGRLAADMASEAAVQRFLARFLELLPERVDRLAASVEAGDVEDATDAALSLGATSGMAGAARVHGAATAVRIALAAGDLPAASAALTLLHDEVPALRDALLDHLAVG